MTVRKTGNKVSPFPPFTSRVRAAFSLVEVLLVVAILGILIAAAMPLLSSSVPAQLQMAAETVAGDLEYIRGLAVANNSNYRVVFSPATNSYSLRHAGSTAGLDKLPPSPFHVMSADGKQMTAELASLPLVGGAVRLVGAIKDPESPMDVTDVEFGPLGGTTRSEMTRIWLASTSSGSPMYISVTIQPTTGAVETGSVQSTVPAGVQAVVIESAQVAAAAP